MTLAIAQFVKRGSACGHYSSPVLRVFPRWPRLRCVRYDAAGPAEPLVSAPAREVARVLHRSHAMAEKLNLGDTFPALTLNITTGGTLNVPADIKTAYAILLFYRGHW